MAKEIPQSKSFSSLKKAADEGNAEAQNELDIATTYL